MTYEVTKKQRGMQGEWFAYKAKRFETLEDAVAYAEQFAEDQYDTPGTRIVVTERESKRFVREYRSR